MDTQRRRLLINLASRAYELEKEKRPATIAELAPDYLRPFRQIQSPARQ
jgi:hypothetical protein